MRHRSWYAITYEVLKYLWLEMVVNFLMNYDLSLYLCEIEIMCKWVIQVSKCSRFLWQSLPDGKAIKVWEFIRIWLLDNYDGNDRELFAWNCRNVVMVMNNIK